MKRKRYSIPKIFMPLLKSEAKALNVAVDRLISVIVEREGITPEKYNAHLTPNVIKTYDFILSKHYGIDFNRRQFAPDMPVICARCGQFFQPTQRQKSYAKHGKRVFCKKCYKRERGGNE